MRWRSVAAGALALIVLDTIVATPAASGRFGQLVSTVSGWAKKFLDPAVPAITAPPRSSGSLFGGSGGGGGALVPFGIPGVPQGPVTGVPFSPIAATDTGDEPISSWVTQGLSGAGGGGGMQLPPSTGFAGSGPITTV